MTLVRTFCGVVATALLVAGSASTEPALAVAASDPARQWGPCPPVFPAGCEITVLHGDPAKPDADVFLRVPGKYELPAHWHTSAERMILVAGELKVKYAGQPAVTLTPGSYALGPAKAPHKASCLSATPCTLFIAFDTPVDAHLHSGALD